MNWLFQTKVFISYSSDDGAWVEGLARQLEVAGFSVFFDKWSIKPGPWRQQIERDLKKCHAALVVLTPAAVKSGVVGAEITALLARTWKENLPFVPVLYKTCEVPELLSTIQQVDFRDQSEEARARALDVLIRGLNGQPPGYRRDDDLPAAVRRRSTLRFILVALLFLVTIGLVTLGVITAVGSNRSLSVLKGIQAQAQQIDVQVAGLIPPLPNRRSAQWDYREGGTNQRIATDWWDETGLLTRRRFYKAGRILAEDTFDYADQRPVRKVRQYFDDDQRTFLKDVFTSDGTLVLKRHCPEFIEASCVDRVTEMMSPLPPASLMGYR